MKLSEFANRIGVSEQTLRNWDKSGKLVAKRTKGNHRFYTEDDYNNYMESSNKNKKGINNMNEVKKDIAGFVDSMGEEDAKKVARQAIEAKWLKDFVDSMTEENNEA